MSETTQEFRDRITHVAHSAMSLPPGDAEYWKEPFKDGDPCHHMPMQKSDFTEVALAVYTQALRDMHDFFRRTPPWLEDITIEVFARQRGIDLTDKEVNGQ